MEDPEVKADRIEVHFKAAQGGHEEDEVKVRCSAAGVPEAQGD